jgi:hypothetical protein
MTSRGPMKRTHQSLLAAVFAAALWLAWVFKHEHTSIRAPWTGLTLAASALGFVAVGVLGRGWRAVLCAVAAAAVAVVLVHPLILHSGPVERGAEESCDPGCVSLEAGMVFAGAVAGALASLGILLRRGLALTRSARHSAAQDGPDPPHPERASP